MTVAALAARAGRVIALVAKSGSGWRLAPALVDLIDEVDARWPNRAKFIDGSIGDASHAARYSEHNPDRDSDGMPNGFVSALDVTKDSAAQMEELRKKIIADPRCWYVIHRGKIWSRTYDFRERDYDGSNAHTSHLHVSLVQSAAGAKAGPWGVAKAAAKPAPVKSESPYARLVRIAKQRYDRIKKMRRRLKRKGR